MSESAKTYGEAIGEERLRELTAQYIEAVPDDGDPNAAGFRRDVSLDDVRALGEGPEAMWAYECLHFFSWRGRWYCRICGCEVLPAWMVQHRANMHSLRLGF